MTDDTSMALCLAHSLVHQKKFDPEDQMNRYCNWYQHGYMSSNGDCFDIGLTVSSALDRYLQTKNPYSGSTDERSSGNGSLMRLAPIPMFYRCNFDMCIKYAGESSRTTHGSAECIDTCKFFAGLIYNAFEAKDKNEIFDKNAYVPTCQRIQEIASCDFLNLDYSQIRGTGYVVDALLSALWCFMKGNSFEESILLAANLGDDADTTAAICGQIAGAYYGLSGIPSRWREKITQGEDIAVLAESLYDLGELNRETL